MGNVAKDFAAGAGRRTRVWTRPGPRLRPFGTRWSLAVVALVLVLATPLTPSTSSASTAPVADEVLFSLPVGDPIAYRGVGPEQLTWGPAAIAASDDGTIWIADGAGHRVLAFDARGTPLRAVDVGRWVVGVGGIAVFGDKLVVLDIAAIDPAVVILDQSTGDLVDSVPVPSSAHLDRGLSGVAVMADGTITAELQGGMRLVAVARVDRSSPHVEPVTASLEAYDTSGSTLRILGTSGTGVRNSARVVVGNVEVALPTTAIAGTVQFAGATAEVVYLMVDDVSQDPSGQLHVDATVRAFDATGASIGMARLPLTEMAARPQQPVAVTAAGQVLALVPTATTVDVVRLAIHDDLAPVLPAHQPPRIAVGDDDLGAFSCVQRSTMSNTDWGYRNNSKYLSWTNINGACSGRTKPRYLASAGTYASVPYKWGGFSTVSQYNNNMSPSTGRAGDINSSAVLSCAHGVDCSGFVSRVWQLTSKHGTWTLPNISSAISASGMLVNDIFNLAGSHTILYKSSSGNGYWVSESTTASGFDRVVYRHISTSYVSSFTPRRYHNVCCDPNVEVCPVDAT